MNTPPDVGIFIHDSKADTAGASQLRMNVADDVCFAIDITAPFTREPLCPLVAILPVIVLSLTHLDTSAAVNPKRLIADDDVEPRPTPRSVTMTPPDTGAFLNPIELPANNTGLSTEYTAAEMSVLAEAMLAKTEV